MNFDSLDESLSLYFNSEIHNFVPTPMPTITTPDIRFLINRYNNSLTGDFNPHRSETPEIPTKRNDGKQDFKLPAVENKYKFERKNKNPQVVMNRIKSKVEQNQRTKNMNVFRKNK